MSIFISIASYEDPSLADTMRSALENAENPDDIVFGLGLQYYDFPDLSEFNKNNLRILKYDPDTRPGIVRIRHEISKLMKDEDFFLQSDSHYKFSKGWDKILIDKYLEISKNINDSRIILLPMGPFEDGTVMSSRFRLELEDSALGHMVTQMIPENTREEVSSEYDEVYFGRVGQIFIPKDFISDIGLDSYSQLTLEIGYFSYRALMSGYRIFRINKSIMHQDDSTYFEQVWKNKQDSAINRFGSSLGVDRAIAWHEMSLALIYNDYSKYAIKNAVMSPERFWELQGESESFTKCKEYYDLILYNNPV